MIEDQTIRRVRVLQVKRASLKLMRQWTGSQWRLQSGRDIRLVDYKAGKSILGKLQLMDIIVGNAIE
jgi:hypothetical protein